MIASLAESLIQRFCGRYLKNFSSNNVSISVTGTITLKDVELRLDSFTDLQLPYKPHRAFIGKLRADLPLVLGGNFDAYVSDVLILCYKGEEPSDLLETSVLYVKALQTIIGLVYTELLETSDFLMQAPGVQYKPKISSAELENGQRLLDRLIVVIERLHFRIEEDYSSHIPCSIGQELLCSGLQVDKLELRKPTSAEIAASGAAAWNTPRKGGVLVNKIIHVVNLSVYCVREDPISQVTDEQFTADFVRSQYHRRDKGTVLEPFSMTTTVSLMYQKLNHCFGPIKINANIEEFNLRVTDEQLAYGFHAIDTILRYVHTLQTRARKHLCYSKATKTEGSRRARLRWMMIRDSIRQDHWRFAQTLHDGSIRWRVWFEQWRLVAKYVALREILMFHSGFEAKYHQGTGSLVYSFAECLSADHDKLDRNDKGERTSEIVDDAAMLNKLRQRYRGQGMFSSNIVKAAEALISNQLHQIGPFSAPDNVKEVVDPHSLSQTAIRALYSLQLELDTLLPVRVCARARMWAEDKYRRFMSTAAPATSTGTPASALPGPSSGLQPSTDPSTGATDGVTLMLAIVDGAGFRTSFGMTNIEAYCSVQSVGWDHGQGILYSETRSAAVGAGSHTALLSWGQVLSIPVSAVNLPLFVAASTTSEKNETVGQPCFRIDCEGVGLFNFSYGRSFVPLASLMDSSVSSGPFEAPIHEQTVTISRIPVGKALTITAATGSSSPLLNTSRGETLDVSLRIMSMIVLGDRSATQAALNRLQARVNEAVVEKQTVVARQEQLERREQQQNGSEGDDEVFILDPSVLSVQDLQIQTKIGALNLIAEVMYHTPSTLRAAVYASNGTLLPYSSTVPLVKVSLRGISSSISGSSNPWDGRIDGSIAQLRIWELQSLAGHSSDARTSDHVVPKPSTYPMVNLGTMSVSINFTQVSTMSPYLDGILDPSCFDWHGHCTLFPVTIRLSSRNANANRATNTKLWTSDHLLSHLWSKLELWSIGGSSSNSSNQLDAVARLHPEAKLRHGDSYTLYPKHLNVVREVWGSIRHPNYDDSSSNGFGEDSGNVSFPPQQTVISLATESRDLAVDVMVFATDELTASARKAPTATTAGRRPAAEPANAIAAKNGADDDHVKKATAAAVTAGVGGFFDWMGRNLASTADIPSELARQGTIKSTTAAAAEAPPGSTALAAERQAMVDKIRALEERNRRLELKLKQFGVNSSLL